MARGIHALNSELAARFGTRGADAVVQADAAAAGLDRAIGSLWQELLCVLRGPRDYHTSYHAALAILRRLTPHVQLHLGKQLLRLADWGHASAADVLSQTLPLDYLRAAAPIPLTTEGIHALGGHARIAAERALGSAAASRGLQRAATLRTLTEDDDPGPEPVEPARTSTQWRELFRQLLFPPPPLELVNRIVFGTSTAGITWQQRIASLSRLAAPETLAGIVADGMLQGLSQRAIAKQLLPAVNNVRASARRIARTEGLRVMHAAQQQAHDQVDDIIAGYQIRAKLDHHTRTSHRFRNGATWFKGSSESKQEALHLENGADFPPDAPNCRCTLTPIMTPPSHIANNPEKLAVFRDVAKRTIPNPQVWNDWFERAPDRSRRIAVGVRRLRAAEDIVGKENLTYAHLVNVKGKLLSVDQLQAETPAERAERIAKVQAIFAQRAADISDVRTFGFVLPSQRAA